MQCFSLSKILWSDLVKNARNPLCSSTSWMWFWLVGQSPGCGFGWLAKVPDVGQVTTSLSLLNTLRLAFVGLVPDDLKSKANRCVLYNADCAVVGGMTFAKVLCESWRHDRPVILFDIINIFFSESTRGHLVRTLWKPLQCHCHLQCHCYLYCSVTVTCHDQIGRTSNHKKKHMTRRVQLIWGKICSLVLHRTAIAVRRANLLSVCLSELYSRRNVAVCLALLGEVWLLYIQLYMLVLV